MLLRPRQREFVERCLAALQERGNTLGIGPTGFGKTIVLSAIAGRLLRSGAKNALILQHREELLNQNASKFRKVNPDIRLSVVNAERKDWRGDAVFGMEPTLRQHANLEAMPAFDVLVIDEAHHVGAEGYKAILDRARERNPKVKLLGVTATPSRGDKQALDHAFDNVADQVKVWELIASGHLVRPRTFVIDVGISEELARVRRTVSDFDMEQVAAIMDRRVVNKEVVRHWKEKAGDRRTVAFCSTIEHAEHVAEAFCAEGVVAEVVHSGLGDKRRHAILAAYSAGRIQVLVNVAILTEGWDDPPTSCVILLRPCSYKSTMIQMIGRGLRVVDPALHPGVVKVDCIVLDFGRSILTHGTIEQRPELHPMRHCVTCAQMVDYGYRCEMCPAAVEEEEEEEASLLEDDLDVPPPSLEASLPAVVMSEIDLFARSNFRWIDLFGDDLALMASGFNAWAGVFCDPLGCSSGAAAWHAVGGGKGLKPQLLGRGERIVALALGDDWMNEREDDDAAHKTQRWLSQPATEAQLQWLNGMVSADGIDLGLNRYHASCLMNFKFSKDRIKRLILNRAG